MTNEKGIYINLNLFTRIHIVINKAINLECCYSKYHKINYTTNYSSGITSTTYTI